MPTLDLFLWVMPTVDYLILFRYHLGLLYIVYL
jgi:hypothetical protein